MPASDTQTHLSQAAPAPLGSLQEQIRQRFIHLRAAIYLSPSDPPLKPRERAARQRAILGDALGLTAEEVAAQESSSRGPHSAVLLALMERYRLPASYFIRPELQLPGDFLVEQQRQALEELRGQVQQLDELTRAQALKQASAKGERKGGWLKGLPRNPKTEAQRALRALWEAARAEGFSPTSLEELRRWGEDPDQVMAEREERLLSASPPPPDGVKRGGWLKGLPRNPKTAAQRAIRQAWLEARSQNVTFTSLKELKAWMEARQGTTEGEASPAGEPAARPARLRGGPPRRSGSSGRSREARMDVGESAARAPQPPTSATGIRRRRRSGRPNPPL